MEVQALVDAACERADADDFGVDTWQEGLEVLLASIDRDANLSELGEGVFADQIAGYLANRLEVETWYRLHPEIDEQQIVAPLFGIGMPRTGSTALSFLLAADRSRRSLRTWEAGHPCPPPTTATEDTDPRIANAQVGIDFTNEMFPDFAGMLPSSATGPQECILIMAFDLRSPVFEGMAFLPTYSDWILACDMEPAYRYHQRVLKLLQWRCPPDRWWLKSPAHMGTIEGLHAVYPDARFVMTHRDLGKVLPSVCAVKDALSNPLATSVDRAAVGRHETELWSESLRRLIAFRDDGHEDRFFDVSYADVQTDPLAAMEVLYAQLGDELTDDTRAGMSAFWAESSSERRTGAPIEASTYGLDADALRKEFAFYHDRFDVPVASDAGPTPEEAAMEAHHATIWEGIADAIPDEIAFVQLDVRRTWGEFEDRAARLAAALLEAGLGPGSKVGELLYNSPEYMETYFAALKIRAVPVNVNYRYVEDEIAYLLDNADAEALVLHASLRDNVVGILDGLPKLKLVIEVADDGRPGVRNDYETVLASHEPTPRTTRDPTDITMIYTGGTTGMPKGVMIPIGPSVIDLLGTIPPLLGEAPVADPEGAVALAVRTAQEGRRSSTIPAPPLMHNTALGMAALPTLLFGGTVVLLNGRKLDVAELWDTAERERVASIIVVGDAFARPMLKGLDERPGRDLSSVNLIASSGAMFSTEVKVGLLEHIPGATILDLIAASEGTMGMAISTKDAPGTTGSFFPNPGVIVVTEDGDVVEAGSGVAGMVALPGGAEGYFKDEAKTAATFRDIGGKRYTVPGDFALVEADGSLTLLGRGSQCINTAGEKVYPEEVEEVLKTHPGVEDCLVFGVPDERFGQRVVAVVAPAEGGAEITADELLGTARTRLASYKLPRRIVTLDVVPRTATGKADYPEAKRRFEDVVAADT